MARTSKSALVLCMDVGFSMSNAAPGQESSFEQAKKVIQKFVQRQVFAETKDELGLVLFGTDATKNPLAADGQYQHISIHRHLVIPDFELLEEIQNDIHPGSQQADWLDALVVCMDLLQKETLGKKCDRLNIALLTDLTSQVCGDQLDVIISNLKRAGITLQFFLPFSADGSESEAGEGGSGADWDGGSGEGGARRRPPHGKGPSKEQLKGLEMVRQIMTSLDEEDGMEEVHSFSYALEMLSIFKRLDRRPMAWPCTLTIGSSLSIRIVGYKAVTEEKVKKSWSVVDAQSARKDDVKRETVYCLHDDNETEVQKEDTIQGYRYGSDIVPFSKVDQEQMKYKSDGKCFSVLGFTKQSMSEALHQEEHGSADSPASSSRDQVSHPYTLTSPRHISNHIKGSPSERVQLEEAGSMGSAVTSGSPPRPTTPSSHHISPSRPPEQTRGKRKREPELLEDVMRQMERREAAFLERMQEMEQAHLGIMRQELQQRERYFQMLLEHNQQEAKAREREFALRKEEVAEARRQQEAFQQGFLSTLSQLVQVLDKRRDSQPEAPPLD